jgi:hypothetical protein
MPDISKASPLRTWILLTGIFLLGVTAGVLGSIAMDFAGQKTHLLFPVARWLDTDFLYLKNGKMVTGRILNRNDHELVLEINNGSLKLKPEEIDRIEENYYTRYFKKVW